MTSFEDCPGDPAPEPSHTLWRLVAAWVPLPAGAAVGFAELCVSCFYPLPTDISPEHRAVGFAIVVVTLAAGGMMTVRGVRRLRSESDWAFVWKAMIVQLLLFLGQFPVWMLLR